MNDLTDIAPAFVEMAHRTIWCSAATVDPNGRPRTRMLHPIWQWDGARLVGWVATGPTPIKRAHLTANPYISMNYWSPSQDTCSADCRAALIFDDETRIMVWNMYTQTPQPLGYDLTIISSWTSPTVEAFAALRLEPWRLRVFPGTALLGQGGQVLTWHE